MLTGGEPGQAGGGARGPGEEGGTGQGYVRQGELQGQRAGLGDPGRGTTVQEVHPGGRQEQQDRSVHEESQVFILSYAMQGSGVYILSNSQNLVTG